MSANYGFSVRIFIPSGEPEGLRIVEKSNWTGQGLVFRCSLFAEVRRRPELTRTGVYVPWDPSEAGRMPRVYVDEGDAALPRATYRIMQDYTLSSPSTAAGVLLGRNSSGLTAWKDERGRSLKAIQEEGAE